MAIKIQHILENTPRDSVLFSSWLSSQGLDARGQFAYMKSGWLDRMSKGVYRIHGTEPSLLAAVSSYNTQLGRRCVVGAYTALELRGYSHYLSMGKPTAYLFTDKNNKLPQWLVKANWTMMVRYMTTSFLGDELIGVETMSVEQHDLLVSSPERAFLECLNLPDASSFLLDLYYIMEGLTTLRPELLQVLLEVCSSHKVKRLFLYMAEKANHPWLKALKKENMDIGTSRLMITPTGKYIKKYNMTISKELAEYE